MKQADKKILIASIKTYHQHLTDEQIANFSDNYLLAFAHPIDREKVEKEIE